MTQLKPYNIIIRAQTAWLLVAVFAPIVSAETRCQEQVVVRSPNGATAFGAVGPNPNRADDFGRYPQALTFDSKGNIYIGDSIKYRIWKFDKRGKMIAEWPLQPLKRSSPRTHVITLQDMATDTSDNVFVINSTEFRVEVYSPTGSFLKSIDYYADSITPYGKDKYTNRYMPENINVDLDGNIYLFKKGGAGKGGGVYSKEGALIKKNVGVDSAGRGINNYNEEKMVGFPGVYHVLEMSDAYKATLLVKDKTGKTIKVCPDPNLGIGEAPMIYFKSDRQGNVYAFNYERRSVTVRKIVLFDDTK